MIYVAPRCQTNADWSTTFRFNDGQQPAPSPIPIDSWTLQGKVERLTLPHNWLDLTSQMVVGDDPSTLTIFLTKVDTYILGAGRLVVEILRIDPPPIRPILKFYMTNHQGVV
jgi:hypothetical protein